MIKTIKAVAPFVHPDSINFKTAPYEAWVKVGGRTAKATGLRDAFILTDDYTVIETLRRDYPDWTFHTLTRPDERGFVYQQAISDNDDNWVKLFAAMEHITASRLFIGTCSSNPGMFAGMVMKDVIYMDTPEWMLM